MTEYADERKKELEGRYRETRDCILEAEKASGRPPGSVRLVVVSKNFPASDVALLHAMGQRVFGENRVQELEEKAEEIQRLQLDVDWHMIGTLQTNKVKRVTGAVAMIESVDRVRVLNAIDRAAEALAVTQDILLEVNISGEASKSGFTAKDAEDVILRYDRWPHVRIRGLMTVAPHEEDPEKTRPVFAALRELLRSLREQTGNDDLKELSMGMTNDYVQAVEEGATIVRIGSAILGRRIYA